MPKKQLTTKLATLTAWPAKRKSPYCIRVTYCLTKRPPEKAIEFQTLDEFKAQARTFAEQLGVGIGDYEHGMHVGVHIARGARKPPGFDKARDEVEYFWPDGGAIVPLKIDQYKDGTVDVQALEA